MAQADAQLIKWLLFESGESMTKISDVTGISESNISRMRHKKIDIDAIKFSNAVALTDYALKMKQITPINEEKRANT